MTTKSTKHTPLPYDAHAKGLEYKKLKREFNDLQNRLNQVLAERIIAQNQRDKLLEICKLVMQSNIDGSYVAASNWWKQMKQLIKTYDND